MWDKMVTYKQLMKVSGRSFQQLVRYALRLFREDPSSPKSGGKARTFEVNDAFMIYLMGVLVDDYGLKLDEAAPHVWAIHEELTRMGLLPLGDWKGGQISRMVVRIHPGKLYTIYEIRTYDRAPVDYPSQKEIRVDEGPYVVHYRPETALEETKPGVVYEIPLTDHIASFLSLLIPLLP